MSGLRLKAMAEFLMRRGFLVVFIIVFLFFSVLTRHFLDVDNILNILRAMAPLAISAAGFRPRRNVRRLISIGSIAFLSCATGALLMRASGLSPVLAALIVVGCGALLGAVNGFIVVVLRVNSLIATLSTMIAFRGIALQLYSGCPARAIATRRSIHWEREARTDTGRYPSDVPRRYSCSFASKSDGLWAPNHGDGQRYFCGSPTWPSGGSGRI